MTATLESTSGPAVPLAPGAGGRAGRRSPVRNLAADALVFAGRRIRHIRQIPEKLLDVTLQPFMFVLLFSYVFGGAIAIEGGTYREYIIGGILVQTLCFGMMGPAMSIATDVTEGVIDRFRSLPASRLAYLLGHYLAEMAGTALAIVLLLGTGLLVGWRVRTDVVHVGLAVVLLVLFASAMIWVGTALGLMVRSPDAVTGVAFSVIFPLVFLSSAFVPVTTLPEVLQWVASWNPISVIVTAVRELFGNPVAPLAKQTWPMEHPVAASFAMCAVLLAVGVPAALRRYRQRTTD